MKALIIKLDRLILDLLTRFVKYYVARHDSKKNKMDLALLIEWIRLYAIVIWAAFLPGVLYAVAGEPVLGVMHTVIWLAMSLLNWFQVQSAKNDKRSYDRMFALRENPEWSKIHGEVLEELFVKGRRTRIITNAALVGITLALFATDYLLSTNVANSMVWQYLLVSTIFSVLKDYFPYVNDFDPPKKKEKAKESISELVQRLWGEFVEGFNPQPAFSPI